MTQAAASKMGLQENRNFQNIRSKRKKHLVKKANELAKLGNLNVLLVVQDPE